MAFFKLLLIVGVLELVTVTGFSQGINLGIKAGVSTSNFITDIESSGRLGFQGGLLLTKWFGRVGIKSEMVYSQQGSIGNLEFKKAVVGSTRFVKKATVKLDYLNIPVIAMWHLAPSFYLQAGPQFGVLLAAEETIETHRSNAVVGTIVSEESSDIKDQFNNSEVGLVLGFGFDLPVGVGFGLRYNLGLTNINENNDKSVKNQVVTLDVSYLLVK